MDGTYSAFEKGQSVKIETFFRQGNWGTRLADTEVPVFAGEERKYLVDFVDMTVQMGGDSWATAIPLQLGTSQTTGTLHGTLGLFTRIGH